MKWLADSDVIRNPAVTLSVLGVTVKTDSTYSTKLMGST
ncbi:hypothetical protein BTBSAS_300007 [Brochothrix thermosphacta]|uniref:Uncharacterized protein n=1 Tax=Brochothrix thermosphacta TaxID=2756 RepID=A0A2X0QLD7_BROTH|nr:hypothetical protein BTBSAS_300007 [Brochothrix thermosphacta]